MNNSSTNRADPICGGPLTLYGMQFTALDQAGVDNGTTWSY